LVSGRKKKPVTKRRIHTEMPSRAMNAMNGTRQPQVANSASPIVKRVARITKSDRKKPSVAVVWIYAVYMPRFPRGACSAT